MEWCLSLVSRETKSQSKLVLPFLPAVFIDFVNVVTVKSFPNSEGRSFLALEHSFFYFRSFDKLSSK